MPPKTTDRPVYLQPGSVLAMMVYCGILVFGFMYFLGSTPNNPRTAAEASDALDVPRKLATDETTRQQ